eukprot:TRINITY_DN304_c0_g3_i1.p1 TRINITY_DN304_c0_g3~~TRINITY_DN304_c0_g3_i1.p1  ORF type:complete len:672 (+),score=108.24 TRINITY_DN304_c0_g3_i1:473-2488(+)
MFIDGALSSNASVLVHCTAGKSRSPALIIAFLMSTYQLSFVGAFNRVKQLRAVVSLNDGFKQQLQAYEKAGHNVYIAHQLLLSQRLKDLFVKRKSSSDPMSAAKQALFRKRKRGDKSKIVSHASSFQNMATLTLLRPGEPNQIIPSLRGMDREFACAHCQTLLFNSSSVIKHCLFKKSPKISPWKLLKPPSPLRPLATEMQLPLRSDRTLSPLRPTRCSSTNKEKKKKYTSPLLSKPPLNSRAKSPSFECSPLSKSFSLLPKSNKVIKPFSPPLLAISPPLETSCDISPPSEFHHPHRLLPKPIVSKELSVDSCSEKLKNGSPFDFNEPCASIEMNHSILTKENWHDESTQKSSEFAVSPSSFPSSFAKKSFSRGFNDEMHESQKPSAGFLSQSYQPPTRICQDLDFCLSDDELHIHEESEDENGLAASGPVVLGMGGIEADVDRSFNYPGPKAPKSVRGKSGGFFDFIPQKNPDSLGKKNHNLPVVEEDNLEKPLQVESEIVERSERRSSLPSSLLLTYKRKGVGGNETEPAKTTHKLDVRTNDEFGWVFDTDRPCSRETRRFRVQMEKLQSNIDDGGKVDRLEKLTEADRHASQLCSACEFIHIEPIPWMSVDRLTQDSGVICCPNPECGSTRIIGQFNWFGSRCSCGQMVTPAFRLHRKHIVPFRKNK